MWKKKGEENMKVYIAGKITGNGRYREEFAAAERKVRAMGHIPLNPAALPEGMEPADYMRICMAMLDSADAIAIMKNWTESTGARIEFAYAQYVNKKVLKLWLMPDFSPKKDVEPEMDVSPERLEELAAADKAGRVVVLPFTSGRTLLCEENIDSLRLMKDVEIAIRYCSSCGIVFHMDYNVFCDLVKHGRIIAVSEEAEKALGAMKDD